MGVDKEEGLAEHLAAMEGESCKEQFKEGGLVLSLGETMRVSTS